MPELRTPWDFHPQLEAERLSIIAEGLLKVLDSTYELLSTPFDDNYTRGTCTFGRQRQYLIQLCMAKTYEWLNLKTAGMDITFEIEGIPIRFFADDPENPKKPGFFRRNTVDQLFSPEIAEPTIWRFVVEKPEFEGEGARIHFVGYNPLEEVLCIWTYGEERPAVLHSVDDAVPHATPIELDPISVAKPDEERKSNNK